MKTFKAISILRAMTENERALFRQFIGLPLFNREQYVAALFDAVAPRLHSPPDNTAIFAQLYPGEPFNDGRIRYLKAQLFALLKHFIFLQQRDALFEDVAVFRYIREKKLDDLYRKEQNKLHSGERSGTPENSAAYLRRYFLSFEWHNHHTKTNRIATEYLDQLNLNLDLFFIIEKLKLACTAFNLRRLYTVQADTSLLDPILHHIQAERLHERHPLLGIYYHAYQMLVNNETAFYHRLSAQLLDKDKNYPVDEIKDAYLLAMNFCIQEINKGNADFYKEAFHLYEQGIQKEILLENGYLSPITYSNAITLALRGKEYDNAFQFIETYKKILQGSEQEGYYFFNLSKYYFETGNFEKVIELYYQSNIKELLLNIQVRTIQIKAFYEQCEGELCQNLVDNLKQLLARKGILAYHKDNYDNFCKIFKQLLALNPYDKTARQKLADTANRLSPLTEKAWLLEKILGRRATGTGFGAP